MKFLILLLLSPLATCTFTSMCPQQPNNVYVNCNNQNPNPFFPGTIIPGRGRILDVKYNKLTARTKLQDPLRYSSEESSSESDESSEEVKEPNKILPHLEPVNRPIIPSIQTITKVNNRLDFGRQTSSKNKMRTVSSPSSRVVPLTSNVVDDTHGHGHSGQYNHNVEHNHHHEHEHGYHHDHVPTTHTFIPTHFTNPSFTISGAHIIPSRDVPMYNILLDNIGSIALESRPPIQPSPGFRTYVDQTGYRYQPVANVYDHLLLTNRGYRTMVTPNRETYALPTQDYQNRQLPTVSIPTIVESEDGLETIINCDPIPLDVLQGTAQQYVLPLNSEMQPVQGSTTFTTDEQVNGQGNLQHTNGDSTVTTSVTTTTKVEKRPSTVPNDASSVSTVYTKVDEKPALGQIGSTVTKVTTTDTEERPMTTDTIRETTSHDTPSSGSTITKVTTTKTEGRPETADTIRETTTYGVPSSGSTITKVTTTKTEARPMTADTIRETTLYGVPSSGSTVTKVTTTKTEGRPVTADTIRETTLYGVPSSGSTITKVTTTKTEERPMTADTIRETASHGTPSSTSTITRVTTTKNEGPPILVLPHETSDQSGSTVSKVVTTTTTKEENLIPSNFETVLSEVPQKIIEVREPVLIPEIGETDSIHAQTSNGDGVTRVAQPIPDEMKRHDSYRQRTESMVHRL